MQSLNKQFAIINKLKALVSKSTGPFRRRNANGSVSETVARKIQRNYYEQSHAKVREENTPPYKLIAEQLQVDNEQIFQGAVFNLRKIALCNEKYHQEILDSLRKALDMDSLNDNQKAYLQMSINVIMQKYR